MNFALPMWKDVGFWVFLDEITSEIARTSIYLVGRGGK